MGLEAFDSYECKGQLSFDDIWSDIAIPEGLLGVSKIFARAKKEMNLAEYKAFVYALANIRFTEKNKNKILLDKKTLAKVVGVNSDIDHLSEDLKRSIGKLPKHSFVEFEKCDEDLYVSGTIITQLIMYKNRVAIKINEDYMSLFSEMDNNYITMWSGDIFEMSSERSIEFYEQLRLNTDTRNQKNYAEVGIKWFKELFEIPKNGKGSYMRKDGHFDRPAFEKYVIDPLCSDLMRCKMISLILQENGKYYTKIKKNGRVIGYRFDWLYSSHPKVATASEVKQIQERVDSNPQVLKVAKDIVKGEKKGKKTNKNSFNNFKQRSYDYTELEKKLLNNNEN